MPAICREPEARSLATSIDRLESDLGPMIERANAWAIGDIDALTRMSYPDNRAACADAFQQTPRLAALLAKRDSEWLGAVESALGRHHAALALVPMWKLLEADGVLQQLGDHGFRADAQP